MQTKRKQRSTSPIREGDANAHDTHLTDEEARIYDRQLRIWGVETQKRMRSLSVLIMGKFGGVAAEIGKNLVLAGIGSVSIADDTPVSEASWSSNFLLASNTTNQTSQASASLQGLQELNPNVKVCCIPMPEPSDVDTLTQFDVVICVNMPLDVATRVNETCRKRREDKSRPVKRGVASDSTAETEFLYVFCRGFSGLWFADWGNFTYHDQTTSTTHTRPFVPLVSSLSSIPLLAPDAALSPAAALATADIDTATLAATVRARSGRLAVKYSEQVCREVQRLAKGADAKEIAPVCAVLGGLVAQEILRSIARDAAPMGGANWGLLNVGESSAITALIE